MFKLLPTARSLLNPQSPAIVRTFKSDLKIKWMKPEKVSCLHPTKSGDNSTMPDIDKTQCVLAYRKSKELESADESVKRLFTLDFNSHRDTSLFYQEQLISQVRRHKIDDHSMEVKIARLTGRIRYLQKLHEERPTEKKLYVNCKELIEKRKQFLKYVRRWDYRRFEWLLEKLDLVYKPQPLQQFNLFRKESLIRLTDAHCEKIRDDRLVEYKKSLQAQQVDFLADKIKKMQFIRKERADMSLEETVTEQDIAAVQQKHDQLKMKREEEMKGIDTSTKWKMY